MTGPERALVPRLSPAPWRLEERQDEWVVRAADGYTVAVFARTDRYAATEQGEANARLVAVAPDLLEVARIALETAAVHPECRDSAACLVAGVDGVSVEAVCDAPLASAVRGALALAEGRP